MAGVSGEIMRWNFDRAVLYQRLLEAATSSLLP
jgi:hypothetical protein